MWHQGEARTPRERKIRHHPRALPHRTECMPPKRPSRYACVSNLLKVCSLKPVEAVLTARDETRCHLRAAPPPERGSFSEIRDHGSVRRRISVSHCGALLTFRARLGG